MTIKLSFQYKLQPIFLKYHFGKEKNVTVFFPSQNYHAMYNANLLNPVRFHSTLTQSLYFPNFLRG